ncbi:PREDICTED: malignant fibrous histiocytoma-amplified sequence 1 homolog [Branchiostoma belcheri]|uniref:Malignant fibrous histiocytoma-amplified sequence 1 homolog n=1 Tax=Branchiostoma belcheri TaxID=7741 RepID=A0A6P4ZQI4_BRABE|nr:PREDICTED: malignant fibrous histiocytoma-amplified sequence 1 homolog [Branchiostoma belcheri]
MEFFNLLENTLAVTEPYGGHVRWVLTILLGMVVAICLHYVVKAYLTRKAEGSKSTQQLGQIDEPRVEDMSFDEDMSFLQTGQDPLTSPICTKEKCTDDHESTFLFYQEQYKDNVDVEHIKLTKQSEEGQPLAIFEEVNQFQLLKTVTIIGLELDDTSLSNLFQCTSIRSLKMSNCQLASIPRSLANLKDLEILDLSHNNLTTLPSRPIRSMPCLKSLNVSHNKLTAIGAVVRKLQALRNLDVSYNNIGDIPYEILEMKSLEFFSCSHNKITRWLHPSNGEIEASTCPLKSLNMSSNLLADVPHNVKQLKHLLLIDLSNNEIGEVPEALLLMPTLRALHLGNNKITKLPTDLDLNKLSPTLCDIDLSNNKLDDLPLVLCFLPSLTKLDLKQNKISAVTQNVKSCKRLSVLDVSHNKLKEIPSHISSVSAMRKDESSIVEVVALAKNCLSHFPEALIQMKSVQKVDLSNNNIKEIPETIMDMPKDVKLELKGNPIIDPPLQVCQAGLETIQAFYEDLTTASSITQCLKTLFLGTYEAGKTSLVRVFQLKRSDLTKPDERTHGIEIAEIRLSAPNTPNITLSVWDFAGQETYYITHQFFLSAKALILLVVNLEECDSARFYSTCGNWVENMIAKVSSLTN